MSFYPKKISLNYSFFTLMFFAVIHSVSAMLLLFLSGIKPDLNKSTSNSRLANKMSFEGGIFK
jgi:hypothetical protein